MEQNNRDWRMPVPIFVVRLAAHVLTHRCPGGKKWQKKLQSVRT